MTRLLGAWLCLPLGVWLGGCTSPPSPDDPPSADAGTNAPGSFFTSLELSVIRGSFGHLPATPPPDASNRVADDPAAAALGQKFFFDARYSQNAQISCASCHEPSHGFLDPAPSAQGLMFTGRHAPTVINASFGSLAHNETIWQFWDGRKDSVWSQALGPPENPGEMGSSRTQIALLIFDKYRAEYEAIFGAMPALRDTQGVGPDPSAMPSDTNTAANLAWLALDSNTAHDINGVYANFGKAIAAYERKLVNRESAFDQFWDEIAAGAADSDALTINEKTGLKLFVGRGGCISCHLGPNLTDGQFHNIGVPQQGEHISTTDNGRADGVPKVLADTTFNCASEFSDAPDKSKCAVMTLKSTAKDLGAFKTPSLRGVAGFAPYFHTGGAATLRDVLDLYNQGGASAGFVGSVDPAIMPLGFASDELDRLVDLLKTFDGTQTPQGALALPPNLPP